MNHHCLLIGGELVAGDLELEVVNPATGAAFTVVPRASRRQADEAIAAAKAAQPSWSSRPHAERADALTKLADAVQGSAEAIARMLVQEQGKPLDQAKGEVSSGEAFLRYFAAQTLLPELLQDDDNVRAERHYRPLGVVAAIAPWNFPFLIACYKIAPAVLLGNTIVFKPAPTTPTTSLMLGALAVDIFPPGVVNVIVDDNDLGTVLTEHPDVAKVAFTGSTATGKRVMQSVSSTLKRLTLELGGNDAGIVLDDADIKSTAAGVAGAAFVNAGQVCIALKRLYVHTSIYDEMCAELAQIVGAMAVGDGFEQGVAVGPLQNAAQYGKAKGYLAGAHRDGRVLAGGAAPDRAGYFIEPTIVCDIEDGAPLVDEEQFAPILPIIRYDDIDAVVDRINSSEYGLGGSVWSRDEDRAMAVARRIHSGTVWVNQHLALDPRLPFGGAKQSGLGVEFGPEGLREFVQATVINVAKARPSTHS